MTHTTTYTQEEMFLKRLEEAQTYGANRIKQPSSVANRLAMSYLKHAIRSAKRDIEEKEKAVNED